MPKRPWNVPLHASHSVVVDRVETYDWFTCLYLTEVKTLSHLSVTRLEKLVPLVYLRTWLI